MNIQGADLDLPQQPEPAEQRIQILVEEVGHTGAAIG